MDPSQPPAPPRQRFAYDHESLDAERAAWRPATDAVRRLLDTLIRTEIDEAELPSIIEQVDAVTARLAEKSVQGSYGVRVVKEGVLRNYGNSVVGLRNAIAPPLEMHRSPEGRAWADFVLGAPYEGPPNLVHGGVVALILDQVFGEAAAAGGSPGMTGTLTVKYLRGTPLGELHAEAWISGHEGFKTFVTGEMRDADGVTAEAHAVFVLPKWARESAMNNPNFRWNPGAAPQAQAAMGDSGA